MFDCCLYYKKIKNKNRKDLRTFFAGKSNIYIKMAIDEVNNGK